MTVAAAYRTLEPALVFGSADQIAALKLLSMKAELLKAREWGYYGTNEYFRPRATERMSGDQIQEELAMWREVGFGEEEIS